MKVSFLTENIINYLPLLNKILPNHTQVPILSNILLLANSDGFSVKATDMEKAVEIKIPAKIEEVGSTTIPGKEFVETISNFPKDKIQLELKDEKVTLKCRLSKVSFNTISGKEFPQLYKDKGVVVASFTKEEFVEIFSYLTFAVSQEESRPQLTGVFIDKKENFINFVATDGYRMSVMKVPAGQKKFVEGLIVSVGLINEVLALKSTGEISLMVNKEENQIIFEVGDVLLVGRMIGGAYPDYEKVIPTSSKTSIVLDRGELLQNVKLSSVFAKEQSNVVLLVIEDGRVRLSTRTQGVGEGESVMEGKQEGDNNRVSFNIRYLSDLARTLSEDDIVLRLNSSNEPALFEIGEKEFRHIIMPIQSDN